VSRPVRFKTRGVLPGFGLSFGYTLFYVGLLVILPLSAMVIKASSLGPSELWAKVTDDRALAAYRLSFGSALAGSLINAVFGVLVAWILVRYRFPGRALVDALVDLPFALPTAVAGIALTTVYAEHGVIGAQLAKVGIKVAFTPLGVTMALTFIGIPFVVRTVQPVLEEIDPDVEEAAAVLGATRLQTFRRVIFPSILPAMLTGFALAFARAVGEYGSISFISGNLPYRTEIVPSLIVNQLEEHHLAGATAIAAVLMVLSVIVLALINWLEVWTSRFNK